MAEKYLLLLDFVGGIVKPVPLSQNAITDDVITIVIDELNECVWVWKGANKSMIESRAAQRQARSIIGLGYEIPRLHLKIGFRAVNRMEIVDGQALDDPDMKRSYDQLMFVLTQQFTMKDETLGAFTGAFIPPESPPPAPLPSEIAASVSPSPETVAPEVITPPPSTTTAASPHPPPESTPEPTLPTASTPTLAETAEPATPTASTPTLAETAEPASPAPSKDTSVVRVGILISSILEYFSSVFCAVKRTEDSALYSIEDSDGILCEVEVKGGSIRFLQRYEFRGKRSDVLTLLQTRLASAGL
jgi:hypothetical protein